MHESRRVPGLLPDLVAEGPRLPGAHVRHEFVDGGETLLECGGPHLVTRQLADGSARRGRLGHEENSRMALWSGTTRRHETIPGPRAPSGRGDGVRVRKW